MDATAIATWVLVLATLVSAGFLGVQLIAETHARNEHNLLLRRRETIRVFTETLDVRNYSRLPSDRDALAVAAFVAASHERPDDRKLISAYLNYWEVIALGTLEGVLDEQLLIKLARSRLMAIWQHYAPVISATTKDGDHVWEQLEKLVLRWGGPERGESSARIDQSAPR